MHDLLCESADNEYFSHFLYLPQDIITLYSIRIDVEIKLNIIAKL